MRRLVELFDRYPPRGRAAGVYAAWRELVRLEPRTGTVRRALAAEVRRSRSFRPELGEFTAPVRRERSQARCLEALHEWASTFEGSGTIGEYLEWRRTVAPAAPSRNTVAAAFGSWRAGLVAAGLSCDRAQPPDRHAQGAGDAVVGARRSTSQASEPRPRHRHSLRGRPRARAPSRGVSAMAAARGAGITVSDDALSRLPTGFRGGAHGAACSLSPSAARPARSIPRPPGPAIPGSPSSPPPRALGSGRCRFRALRRVCSARFA